MQADTLSIWASTLSRGSVRPIFSTGCTMCFVRWRGNERHNSSAAGRVASLTSISSDTGRNSLVVSHW